MATQIKNFDVPISQWLKTILLLVKKMLLKQLQSKTRPSLPTQTITGNEVVSFKEIFLMASHCKRV